MTLQEFLLQAYQDRQLNKVSYDELSKWLTDPEFEEFLPELRAEIEGGDWVTLMDKFYRVLIFGTGGLRGTMDIGTNRLNAYMIRWASQAWANYLYTYKKDIVAQGVAIAYDSRINSQHFMKETARVLAANGIPTYIFKYYRATPELSFAVRHLKLAGGIVVTASHNPPEFNGYKVYDERGVQVLLDVGAQIEEQFYTVKEIQKLSFDDAVAQGKIQYISDDVDRAFAESAKKISIYPGRDTHIVYSPLHGVGSESVLPVLKECGFSNITLVEEEMAIDGNFPNVEGHFPNPEFPIVYKNSIALAEKVKADIIIVSDPDADRVGVAIPDNTGVWHILSGNQGAVLLGYFYLKALAQGGRMPKQPVVLKTSVTTELIRDIAESFGAEVIGDLLVGFKFLGDRQELLPADKTFIYACEESCGYCFSNDYRDKGAETPALVAAEMSAWCRAQNTTPLDLLESIYREHGYYAERLYYRLMEGFGSFDRMNLAMAALRKQLPTEIAGRKVLKVLDRATGEVRNGQSGELLETRDWDKGDMLSFFFTEDERNAIHVRPSGTEPKMKYYTAMKGRLAEKTKADIEAEAEAVEVAMVKIFEDILAGVVVDVF